MKNLLIFLSIVTVTVFSGCTNTSKQSQKNRMNEEENIVQTEPGFTTVKSQNSVDDTYQNLVQAIESKKAISIIAELNHTENAASVDMDLRPTRILMFGNPKLGTPLMQAGQTAGLDLPQKVLVYENAEGEVFIAYNDPAYLAERHTIEGQKKVLNKISGALEKLAEGAAAGE
jgi:uncharacterized protein (DUF302 family)